MALQVFISYARVDGSDEAERLYNDLHQHGISAWRDTQNLDPYADFSGEIEEAIRNSSHVAVCVTPDIRRADSFVRREIAFALEENKPIIPLVFPGGSRPITIINHTYIDFTEWDKGIAALLKRLQRGVELMTPETRREYELAYLQDIAQKYDHWRDLYTDLAATATLDEPPRIKLKKGAAVRYLDMHHEIFEKINHDPEPTDSIRVENFKELREGIRKYRRVALIGDPGAGKTTTLERLAYELAAEAAEHEAAPLPLLVRLGAYDGSDFETFLEGSFGQLTLKPYLPGRVFLLLDGLNETPPEHVKKIQDWIHHHDQTPVIVSCRKLDYTGLKLPLQRIDVAPLDLDRIYLFLGNYLEADDQENLFWSLAGDKLHKQWKTWKQNERTFDEFLQAVQNIRPNYLPGLLGVVTNPFLLFVTIQIYTRWGKPPKNRGQLFENFVTLLMAQRGQPAAVSRPPWIEEHLQIKALSALAHRIQMERKGTSVSVEWAKSVIQEVYPDSEQLLYLAASASIIEYGSRIRFVHQLLQEYFAAHRMLEDMKQGVPASKYWPLMIQWWLRVGWEETAVLMAGLQGDASDIIQWIAPVQPILAYRCLKESGADYSEAAFRMLLHPPAGGRVNPIAHIEWLQQKIAEEGDKRTGVGLRPDGLPDIEWVEIPAGYFTFGGRKTRVRTVYDSELPERKIRLPQFHIARYPVTWLQYQAFVEASDGYASEEWWTYSDHARQWRKDNPTARQTRFNHPGYPRVQITWYEAVAFCQWLSARLNEKITLPTEQQWEKAARGTDRRLFPWGENYLAGYANCKETEHDVGPYFVGRVTIVGSYPHAASPYGVLDMSGNVMEWCLNEHGNPKNTRVQGWTRRVVRGGSWDGSEALTSAIFRLWDFPERWDNNIGFRLCRL